MVKRLSDRCIVAPNDVTPSQKGFEVIGTFNPGVIRLGDMTYFLLRVAEKPKEKRAGQIALPRVENGSIAIDWQKADAVNFLDARMVRFKANRYLRLTNISHLRLAKSQDGINIDSIDIVPTIFPEEPYEEFGVEDARITPIGDTCYITYVAVSRHGISTALASTKDFVHFERHGIIFATENKDVVIFPEKIGNRYVALHRPLSANPFGPPEIWMAYSPDLIHWGNHHYVIGGGSNWDFMKVGAGAPPIKTEEGWLEIYHGSYKAHEEDTVGVYSAGAALFHLDNPQKLIAKSDRPILMPETEYERKEGFLSSIVFPTGIVVEGDELLIYYGAADTYTAVTKLSLPDVLDEVKNSISKH